MGQGLRSLWKGKPRGKGGDCVGKDLMPPGAYRRQAWSKDRTCQASRAIYAQTDPQTLSLADG
jgi:hypothetical protein